MEDGAIDGLEFGVDEEEWLGRELGTALGDDVGSVLGLDVVGFLVGVVLGSVELIPDGAGTGGTVSTAQPHQSCSSSHFR